MKRRSELICGPILLLAVWAGAAIAQESKTRAIEPIRVSIASDAESTAADRDFNERLQRELGRRGVLRFTSTRFDAKILTSSTEITEGGKPAGYASSVAILTKTGDLFSMRLHIATASTLGQVAEDCAAWLDKELKSGRR